MRIVIMVAVVFCCVLTASDQTARAGDTNNVHASNGHTDNHVDSSATLSNNIEGQWVGTWTTERFGGDRGPLRCTIALQPDGSYLARFRATYKGFLPFVYTVTMTGSSQNSHVSISGSVKLAEWAGGQYTFSGSIRGDTFVCEYISDKDKGVFELRRVR